MERIDYTYTERDNVLQEIQKSEKTIVEDVAINLSKDGIPQTCYFVVDDIPPAPPPEPDYKAYYDGMQEVITGA